MAMTTKRFDSLQNMGFTTFDYQKGRLFMHPSGQLAKSLGATVTKPLRIKTSDVGTLRSSVLKAPKRHSIFNCSQVYNSIRAKIDRFEDLKKGWDSYGADPPSVLSVLIAKKLIDELEKHSIRVNPDKVIPTSDKSILISFENRDVTVEFEFDSDGDIGVMTTKRNQNPVCHDISAQQISSFVNQLVD